MNIALTISRHFINKRPWEAIALAESVRHQSTSLYLETMKDVILDVANATVRPCLMDAVYPMRRLVIVVGLCVDCGGQALKFDDELSKKEYSISGLCQKCQDEVFE